MDRRSRFRRRRCGLYLWINQLVVMKAVKRVILNTLLIVLALFLIDYFIHDSLTIKNAIKIAITGIVIGLINYKLYIK
ncbi:hypothetical protein CKF42_06625 [Pantoea sp. ARC270]|nr:hypothetical protein CKF42_06625 [Pantoea sp. ARC270]